MTKSSGHTGSESYFSVPEKDEVPSDGRIMFKKPTGSKRDKSGNDDLPESEVSEVSKEKKKKKDKKAEKQLLSFQDDDDE